jgi:hypothetical protein
MRILMGCLLVAASRPPLMLESSLPGVFAMGACRNARLILSAIPAGRNTDTQAACNHVLRESKCGGETPR